MSGNHNGSIDRAIQLVEAAKQAGADAIKLQTYTADTITIQSDREEFRISGTLWDGRTLYDLYEEAHTPWDWHAQLFEKGRELGITVFSSPFDSTAVELLEGLDAPAYKIASPELVDIPLIERVAATGKPMIISTGMGSLEEIGEAIEAAKEAGCNEFILLHCVSAYPTAIDQANLASIPYLKERFGGIVGLSDHTMGITVATASVVMGANVIEKHFTLSRTDGGVDCEFSLEPHELARLVNDTRDAWSAIGTPSLSVLDAEQPVLPYRRSLYVVSPIRRGERLTHVNIRSIRPANGLKPKYLKSVIGAMASQDIDAGQPLTWQMIGQGKE